MPFQSRAQQGWAFAQGMPFAHEWGEKTKAAGGFEGLPQYKHGRPKNPLPKSPYRKKRKRVRKAFNPNETSQQRMQRRQRQVQAGIMLGASVPAIMALRSGRAANVAGFAGRAEEQARQASRQLHHAATGIALGGLAGAVGVAPVPRLAGRKPRTPLTPNSAKRYAKPKMRRNYTNSGIGKSDTLDGFGVDRPDLFSKAYTPKTRERAEHYGRMSGATATLGATAGTIGAGAGVVGHLERKGHDPMGFAHPAFGKPLKGAARTAALAPNVAGHMWQAKAGGALAGAGLGLAGAYKYKQRKAQVAAGARRKVIGKALTPQRKRQAGDVALGTAAAGTSAAALAGGMKVSHIMSRDASQVGREGLLAHHLIAGHKLSVATGGEKWATPGELKRAKATRALGVRVMGVKKPAALAAAGTAAAGGAGLYELGRHAVASRRRAHT